MIYLTIDRRSPKEMVYDDSNKKDDFIGDVEIIPTSSTNWYDDEDTGAQMRDVTYRMG